MDQRWSVETRYVKAWFLALDAPTQYRIAESLKVLEPMGPSLGRPLVDSIRMSSLPHLKELRPPSAGREKIRILFAFDPHRVDVLLVGGNKAGAWNAWYPAAIAEAETLCRRHLTERPLS